MVLTNQWLRLTLVLVLALLTRILWASPPSRAVRLMPRERVISETLSTTTPWDFTTAAGVAVRGESVGFSSTWELQRQIRSDLPIYVGADLAINYWRETTLGVSILPSAEYRFPSFAGTWFQPSIGLALGTQIRNAWYFHMYVKPSAQIRINPLLSADIEPRLGFIGSDFIFSPVATASFSM